jgi:hypothetical protein
MPYAITTVGQGGAVSLTMPSCSINAGSNPDVSGIEFDVKPMSGNAAGFFNIAGISGNNTTALRIEVATGTLQWRYSGTIYLASAAGVAPMNEKAKYGAEYEESTTSLYLTKNGARIAGPYIAAANSLTTNIAWNQVGKVGTSSPSPQTFELYGVRTFGGNATYQATWVDTGASGGGVSWADDSATRNITIVGHTGAVNSWWMFYNPFYIGESTLNVIATATAALTGFKVGHANVSAVVTAAVAVEGCKIGSAVVSMPLAAGIELSSAKVGVGDMPVQANADVNLYAGNFYIGSGTFSVSAEANLAMLGSKVGHSQVEFAAAANVYLQATKIGNCAAPISATSALSVDGYKIGYATAVLLVSATVSLSGSRVIAESTPITVVFLRTHSNRTYNRKTSSALACNLKTSSRYQYHLKTFSGGNHA